MSAAIIIGSAMSAIGQLQAGANAQSAGNYNAKIAFNNADAARRSALEDARRHRRSGQKRAGINRAIDPDKLDLLEDNAIEEELMYKTIVHGGEVKAVGYENTGQFEIFKGRVARKASYIGAASTMLLGAGMASGGGGTMFASTPNSAGLSSQYRLSAFS